MRARSQGQGGGEFLVYALQPATVTESNANG